MKKQILLLYPEFPRTYWSFDSVFKYTPAKASYPPLGLLTVASMIPDTWDLKLIDMNVTKLKDQDIIDADIIFISGMLVQKKSFHETVSRCKEYGKTIIAGGPYATTSYHEIDNVDHFITGECEETLSLFFDELKTNRARRVYIPEKYPDICTTPPPRFDLIDTENYHSMALQFSRGCPFNCEFCDIIEIFGRTPRTKNPEQMLREFEILFNQGYRGSLFIVDDNFIGNKKKAREFLQKVLLWQKKHNFPFSLSTEASVNLADDPGMIELMVACGFKMVFMGLESPSEDSLKEADKGQNIGGSLSLLEKVQCIQEKGIEVSAGFIVGFDSDNAKIFSSQEKFIEESAVPMAMIGLLQALPASRLYRRLESEGRLVGKSAGNNTNDLQLNFNPLMDKRILVEGYISLLKNVYQPSKYFGRVYAFLKRLPKRTSVKRRVRLKDIKLLFRFLASKITKPAGIPYLSFLAKILLTRPSQFSTAARFAIMGEHLIDMTRDITDHYHFCELLESNQTVIASSVNHIIEKGNPRLHYPFKTYCQLIKNDVKKNFKRLSSAARESAKNRYNEFIAETNHKLREMYCASEEISRNMYREKNKHSEVVI